MKWSEADCEYLLANYEQHTVAQLSDALGRSKCAIRSKLHWYGVTAKTDIDNWWTPEEVDKLRLLLQTHSKPEAAEHLGRSLSAVKHVCFKHKLKPKIIQGRGKHAGKLFRTWDPDEINWLITNAGKMPIQDAADKLGRSYKAVHEKCKALNISWVNWKISLNALGEFFGVSPSTVNIHKRKLGHEWDRYTPPTTEEIQELAGSMLNSDQIMTRASYLRQIRDGHINPWEFMAVRGTPYGKKFPRIKHDMEGPPTACMQYTA